MSLALVGLARPTPTFAGLGLPAPLVQALTSHGITRPLPIQAATIADALAGRDVLGKAPTGSGKTLAFALPLAASVRRGAPRRPKGLVLAPTRELAAQIDAELAPLLAVRRLRSHPFYGGVGFGAQRQALRRGVDVAVACPGRLEDLMRSGDIALADVDIVVVDEADRMADMGFLPAVRRVLDATDDRRQTLLFSATLDGDVDVLVRRYQRQPVSHEVVADSDEVGLASHRFETVALAERVAACTAIVTKERSSIVFVRTKHGADRLARQLTVGGVRTAVIHGGRSQDQRDRALAAFRSGRVQALVATDVAARGVHVDAVACVVHFDLPAGPKDYVHRSGRTARTGAAGRVVTLVTPDQQHAAVALQRALDIDISGLVAERGASRPVSPGRRGRKYQRRGGLVRRLERTP
ncbi:MAG: DEAD/DEAH box helicase [Acidimicrobiales bacterium]